MKSLFILFLILAAFGAHSQITSTFDTDADGWTALNGSTGDPVYFNTAGNPGGFIRITDGAPGNATYFVAPDNDGKNDFFKIANIDLLEPENTVTIYNRWGSKVFETENYSEDNAFRGLSNNGNELPSGTYFYKILLKSTGRTETGYLVLKK